MSAAQLLSGSRQMAEMTSSTETLWKPVNEKPVGAAEKVGDELCPDSVSVKNVENS